MNTRMTSLTVCAVGCLVLTLSGIAQAQDFTWTYKTPMPHGRGSGAAASVGGVIYTIGGHEGSLYGRYNEAYNTSTDTWTSKAPLPHSDGRYGLAAIGVNGKVYTFGGTDIWGTHNHTNIDEYNPSTDTWIPYKANYPISVARMAVAECNGKIYVFGGWLYQMSNAFISNVYEYDPLTNIVTQKASMPTARADAFAGCVAGKIYVIGGYNYVGLDVVEMYDPDTDDWTTGFAPMPTGGDSVQGGVISNRIYVTVGGIAIVYEYNPSANSWTEKNPMQTPRGGQFMAAVGNRLYAMGGWSGPLTSSVEEGTLTIEAVIDVDPDTLNLSSKDKWVTCYIELPSGYEVMDIDGASVKLEGIFAYIGAEGWAKAGANSGNIMDHDGDGILERMVKFDGAAVRGYLIGLGASGYVGLSVTGDLVDGPSFEGIDVIRVIK